MAPLELLGLSLSPPLQILLATYNGAKWLPEQLASLDAQENAPEWNLLWRDDGSADCSAALVALHPRARCAAGGGTRLGAARSFTALLAAAPEAAPAYAFCDQDDVWLPHKLATAWDWIRRQPAGRPALYCARQQVVDATLNPLRLSPPVRRPPSFSNALVENIAVGCTVMLNPMARRLLLAAPPPPKLSMHDWWAYLLVMGTGGAVWFDPRPAVLYRQHGGNCIGTDNSALARARGALNRGAAHFRATLAGHLTALETASPLLSEEARSLLAQLRPLPGLSPLARLQLARQARLYRQRRLEDYALAALMVLP